MVFPCSHLSVSNNTFKYWGVKKQSNIKYILHKRIWFDEQLHFKVAQNDNTDKACNHRC